MGDARGDGATCIDDSTLAAFAEGGAGESVQVRVEQHVAACGECRTVLARVAHLLRSRVDRSRPPQGNGDRTGDALAQGTCVGRYVVERLIGSGAMGAVYAARDPDLDRVVAVKLLWAGALSENERSRMRARLLREAKAMARLSHPDVITLYDVGAFGDQLFVAMEHVDGGTLRQWRSERHRSYAEILAVYERAGSGLAAAHEAGLVHRDVKPDNVLIGRDGRVRVTDFGLARAHDGERSGRRPGAGRTPGESDPTTTLTGTGALLGTPAYMAPEQLRGRPADARSDVFSFCVALYEALYGERPFAGRTVAELRMAIEQGKVRPAPLMSSVPGWVRATLLRGLQPDPDQRFPSMRELLDALRQRRALHRRRAGILAAGGALVALAAAGGVLLGRRELRPSEISTPSASAAALRVDPTESSLADDPLAGFALSHVRLRAVPSTPVTWHVDVTQSEDAPKPAVSVRPRDVTPAARASDRAPRIGTNGALILE